MKEISLNVEDGAYEHVMYFLNSLPRKDVQIIESKNIEEIDPTALPKDDFDYMSKEDLKEIDKSVSEAKKVGFSNLQSYEEFKNDL